MFESAGPVAPSTVYDRALVGAAGTQADGKRQAIRQPGTFNVAAHGLRGVAAVMVLLAHIFGGTAKHVYPHDAGYVAAVVQPWNLGTFGVELFFAISGFVIVPSALRYRPADFAIRRLLRIYPLFLVLSIVFVVMNAVTNAYPETNNARAVVAGLLFLNLFTGTEQLTPNAWSLSFEIAFYVLTLAVVHFVVRQRARVLGAAAIGLAIAFSLAFPIAVYFLVGVAAGLIHLRTAIAATARRGIEMLALAAMIYLASRAHFAYEWRDFANPVVVPLILATACYFWLAVMPDSVTARLLDNRVAAYVGTVSFSLYLVHPYVYFGARLGFVQLGWFTDDIAVSMAMFTAVVVAGSFALTHVFHVTLERWPYQWYFKERIYRTTTAAKSEPETAAR